MIVLSPEAWAALTAIVLPLVAALAANIRLTMAVQSLTREMHAVRAFVADFPLLEKRVAKLEGRPSKKAQVKKRVKR